MASWAMNPSWLRSFGIYPFSFRFYFHLSASHIRVLTYQRYALVTTNLWPHRKKTTTTSDYKGISLADTQVGAGLQHSHPPYQSYNHQSWCGEETQYFKSYVLLCPTPPTPSSPTPLTQSQSIKCEQDLYHQACHYYFAGVARSRVESNLHAPTFFWVFQKSDTLELCNALKFRSFLRILSTSCCTLLCTWSVLEISVY